MKKKFNYLAMVLITALLLPVVIRVGAQEFASSSSSSSAFITFYNVKDLVTTLYVKKQVENSAGKLPSPVDDEFDFFLKLNGSVARDQAYVLYNADNLRIWNYEDGQTTVEDKNKMELELKTDQYGRFTLKDGYTAHFMGLAPGTTYEVTENEYKPYEQIDPVSGSARTGTVKPDGESVVFRNFIPDTPGSQALEVRKSISYPANYELPETPEFPFSIKINGRAYGNMDFAVMDLASRQKIGDGKTDADGKFTLQGNTYALFSNVPADVDYEVEEILDDTMMEDGWRTVGDALQEGATITGTKSLTFGNVLASFVVSKEMYGGVSAPDDSFEFRLIDESGQPFADPVSYYLYDSTLQLVDQDRKQTAADGSFTLKSGQSAVFIGLDKGTKYGVREMSSGRYVQYLPISEEGYTGKVVGDSVETLPFINAVVPSKTLLTVKKTVVNNSDKPKVPDMEFTFQISKLVSQEGEEPVYEPLNKAAYDIMNASGVSTYETDGEGKFKLRAWQTARFSDLKKGDVYKVEELEKELPEDFSIGGEQSKEGELGDDVLEMQFLNDYENPKNPEITIRKETEDGKALAGAKLQLIRKDGDKEIVLHEWISKETAEDITVADGPGTYYIREIEAPKGYLVAEDMEIKVDKSKEVQMFQMVDERDASVDLPGYGGEGIRKYLAVGAFLIIAACVLLAAKSRKRSGNKN